MIKLVLDELIPLLMKSSSRLWIGLSMVCLSVIFDGSNPYRRSNWFAIAGWAILLSGAAFFIITLGEQATSIAGQFVAMLNP